MSRTPEEQNILTKFFSGVLDGQVGDFFTTKGGSIIWTAIKEGKIIRYKQGPGGRFFNGKENEYFSGVKHIIDAWVTEDQILAFFQKFGWLLDDVDVQAYSAKFKNK